MNRPFLKMNGAGNDFVVVEARSAPFHPGPEEARAIADRKGDVLYAQNKLPEARDAYQQALDKTEQKDPGRQLIQLKLDAIGGAAKAAV